MLKKPTLLKLIFQANFLILCLFGKDLWAQGGEFKSASKNFSLEGARKIVLYVQNSKLKMRQVSSVKKEIKIFSNFGSLLNKTKVKKIIKAGVLHIWIFKTVLIGEKIKIEDSAHIGEVLIQVPVMPVELVQNLGSVSIEFWKSPLIIKKWKGSVSVKNTQKNLSIFLKQGSVNIESYSGNLKIESYNNKLAIKNSKGKFKLNIFSGEVFLSQINAKLDLSSYNASLQAIDIQGALSVKTENSFIKLSEVKSSVRISLVKGKVQVSKIGAISLNISSLGSANIDVELNKRAARLVLQSGRLKIKAPSELKRKAFGIRGEKIKAVLSGNGKKAFLVLKNTDGRIKLRP